MDLLCLGEAVCDGEGGVVEGVGTLGVPVTPALPALYRIAWSCNVEISADQGMKQFSYLSLRRISVPPKLPDKLRQFFCSRSFLFLF